MGASLHIDAELGDIAETVFLPGDPLRAKHIAETYLDDPLRLVRHALLRDAVLLLYLQKATVIKITAPLLSSGT